MNTSIWAYSETR